MQTDVELLTAYRNGDAQAFETLYERYVRRIYDYVYYRILHRETAEDITSQTFLQAIDHLSSFQFSRGTFSAWLHRIARNLLVDHVRSFHPHDSIDDVWDLSSQISIPHDTQQALLIEQLQPHLQSLKPTARDILFLRIWQGLSFKDIAELTDNSEAACKMSYRRSIEQLKNTVLFFLLFISTFFLTLA